MSEAIIVTRLSPEAEERIRQIVREELAASGPTTARELISVEEAERRAAERAKWWMMEPSGVACPNCGAELMRSSFGTSRLGSGSTEFAARCPNSDWQGSLHL